MGGVSVDIFKGKGCEGRMVGNLKERSGLML